jgi:hypothetical protein
MRRTKSAPRIMVPVCSSRVARTSRRPVTDMQCKKRKFQRGIRQSRRLECLNRRDLSQCEHPGLHTDLPDHIPAEKAAKRTRPSPGSGHGLRGDQAAACSPLIGSAARGGNEVSHCVDQHKRPAFKIESLQVRGFLRERYISHRAGRYASHTAADRGCDPSEI